MGSRLHALIVSPCAVYVCTRVFVCITLCVFVYIFVYLFYVFVYILYMYETLYILCYFA